MGDWLGLEFRYVENKIEAFSTRAMLVYNVHKW